MINLFKSGTTLSSGTIGRNNFIIGIDEHIGYGPTASTGFWAGITPPSGGYSIYTNKAANGPNIYTSTNDTNVIITAQKLGGTNINTIYDALIWFDGQSDNMIVNMDYPSIATSGLTLLMDAGYIPSYPRTGSTWNDISIGKNSATLFNSPNFSMNSEGVLIFNGIDNYASGSLSSLSLFSFGVWVNVTSTSAGVGILSPSTGGVGIQISGGEPGFQFFNAVPSGTTITTNTWYYVVGTQDEVNQKLYINGSLVSTVAGTTTVGGTYYIGKRFDNLYANANIGAVQIYNRPLTPTEIQNNYDVQFSRYFTVTLTPTATPTQTPTPSITASQTQTPTQTQTQTPTNTVTQTPTHTPTVGNNNITLTGYFFSGSIGAGFSALSERIMDSDFTTSFTAVLGVTSGGTISIPVTVVIPTGQLSGFTQTFEDGDYNSLNQTVTLTNITYSTSVTTPFEFTQDAIFNVTPTPTPAQTSTPTPSVTNTVTQTPTNTVTQTPTNTETTTNTPSETATQTPTNTASQTMTPTNTETPTPTPTATPQFFILAQDSNILTAQNGSGIEYQH
jgi:hypothetical protein